MSQGKFSETPYYLIEEYFDALNKIVPGQIKPSDILYDVVQFSEPHLLWDSENGYVNWGGSFQYLTADVEKIGLRGLKIHANAEGSSWTKMFAKIEDKGFVKTRLRQLPEETWKEGNTLHFEIDTSPENLQGIFVVGEDPGFDWDDSYEIERIDEDKYAVIYKRVTSPDTENPAYRFKLYKKRLISDVYKQIVPSTEIYFRKDSTFHNWFKKYKKYEKSKNQKVGNDVWDHEDFLNDRSMFLYFGKIYNNILSTTYKNIIYYSLKDFAINILPENNRTEKYSEWLWQSYDRNHFATYNVQKNLSTLLDPDEIPAKFLGYLAKFYNYNIDSAIIEEERQRQLVKSIIYQLKRKGAWSGIYLVWKVLSGDTKNDLNLYELWHTPDLYEEVEETTIEPKRDLKKYFYSDMNLIKNGILFSEDSKYTPYVGLKVSPTEGLQPLNVRIESEINNGNFTSIQWNYGDGSSLRFNPKDFNYIYHDYIKPGDFILEQIVEEEEFGKIKQSVKIKVEPNVLKYTLTFKPSVEDIFEWRLSNDPVWKNNLSVELPADNYMIYVKDVPGYKKHDIITIELIRNTEIKIDYIKE